MHLLSSWLCLMCVSMKIPRSVTSGQETLLLSPNFDINSGLCYTPNDLAEAIERTRMHLFTDNLGRLVVGRGSTDSPLFRSAKTLNTLVLSLDDSNGTMIRSVSEEAVASLETRSEEYTLSVPGDGGDAILKANTTLGLLRGLTTFEQLWYTFEDQVYAIGVPLDVEDGPAYVYALSSFPVPDIKRTLDAMSWVKFNILYWHIVDSQSFPLEVDTFPELSKAGAYSKTQVYTGNDVQDIIEYAAAELDTPEHVACYLSTPWADFANEPPAGQLRLASPSTINFSVALVDSVSQKFRSTLFSTGGDEVNENCYTQDTQTQADLAKAGLSLDEALNNYLLETHAVIRAQGKTPIVKEDIILNHNTTLPNTTIAVVWISSQDAINVTSKGYRVIHQPSDYFYLDCGGGGWLGDDIALNSWCDPFKTWQRIYSFDPLANLTAEASALVLGGTTIFPQNLDPIVWPRAASAAEVFWSGGKSNGAVLNVTSALPRLHDVRFRMVQRGVQAIALQPEWCALRPDACDFLNAFLPYFILSVSMP
ncbi:beta-hexosaminidase [Phellopilus nigrolimitatus]|nr:beta-hexosaminidase [Phellopilus nigrolimitatus]